MKTGQNILFSRYLRFVLGSVILMLLCVSSARLAATEIPHSLRQDGRVLIVGVRDAAKPFSYKTARRSTSPLLTGYGGYMVEICRRVLGDMLSDGYFSGYRVLTKEVSAGSRFSLLDTGQVDILCGPDSITQNRLQRYTTSHPVFLSGVVLVSRLAEDFPRTRYCKGVVGMVRGTTAASSGLEQMLLMEDVIRFKPALLSFLSQYGLNNATHFRTSIADNIERWIETYGASGVSNVADESGQSPIVSELVVTGECPRGFELGPVVFYRDHQEGVNSFCQGNTLFYLGDVDLLKAKFDAQPACQKVFQRTTLTREAYGIYFRKVANTNEESFSPQDVRDAILYAQFNNVLLRKMQDSERILEYEYKQEFGEQEQGYDLMRFFESFQYANNY